MLSADNFCKQVGPRSAPTQYQDWSRSDLFDTQMVFLKEFLEKVDFEKKSADDKNAWKITQGAKSKVHSVVIRLNMVILTLYMLGIFSWFFVVCRYFYNYFFFKFQEWHQCQTAWTLIRPESLSDLIWFPTVSNIISQIHQDVKIWLTFNKQKFDDIIHRFR